MVPILAFHICRKWRGTNLLTGRCLSSIHLSKSLSHNLSPLNNPCLGPWKKSTDHNVCSFGSMPFAQMWSSQDPPRGRRNLYQFGWRQVVVEFQFRLGHCQVILIQHQLLLLTVHDIQRPIVSIIQVSANLPFVERTISRDTRHRKFHNAWDILGK